MNNQVSSRRKNTEQPKKTWVEWLAWIALEDHCEWANQYVALTKTPLGVLVIGAVMSLLCGIYVAPQGYAILGAILAVIAVGLVWPWLAVKGISGDLEFLLARGREGKPCTAKLIINNRWPWPVWGLSCSDPLLVSDEQTDNTIALARIEAWSRATFNCNLTPARRGVYPCQKVAVSTGFPFGLYEAKREVTVINKVTVWPKTFWLPPLGNLTCRQDWSGELFLDRAGTEGSRIGVRDYRHGDVLRDMHWAKSARYDRPIVNEREAAAALDMTLVVDLDPERHTTDGNDSTLEWSLRIAASICESVVGQHGTVTLCLGTKKLTGIAEEGLSRLLDAIASAKLCDQGGLNRNNNTKSAVLIGTDSTPKHTDQFICLSVDGFDGKPLHDSDDFVAWILIDSSEDVPGQVLRGWRVGPKRISHAN